MSIGLRRGELVALVGPNGSGKSTFIKSVYGLANLFEGHVYLDGRDITSLNPEEKSTLGIQYVPQIDNTFPDLKVRENLEMGAYLTRDPSEIRATMESVVGLFPILGQRLEQLASTLSGGERQMLAVGRAMMARPTVLFLDEPTAALAPRMVAELFRRVLLIRDSGVSVLLVEQHAKKALEIADRGYVLVAGKTEMKGTGAEILANEDLKRVFLGRK
ncbi:MAG TPA: ABC transporter ATP-binding protein [Thermoplasmata archaeon]|nr:ABC transporter ATP-binding protein [Thermoplasmata archaeon]HLA47478.1 ABC transporter ATP-binding protein [Thermoplasmata archaeon]